MDNNKQKITFRDRFKYMLENMMMKGIVSRFILLFIILAVSTLLFGVIMYALHYSESGSLGGSLWESYLNIMHQSLRSEDGSLTRMVLLYLMALIGVMFSGSITSIITTSMARNIDKLSKGETKVQENLPHIVVLGYNEITMTVIEELAAFFHHTGRNNAIVVMDEEVPAATMTSEIDRKIKKYRTKVICRNGSICNMTDLDIVSLERCAGVIINADDDFEAIEAILAVTGKFRQFENDGIDRSNVYVNAVVNNKDKVLEARIAGGKRIKVVCYEQVTSKILAGAGREPGMSYVHQELMDYVHQGIFYYDYDKLCGEGKIPAGEGKYSMSRYLENAIAIGGIPQKDERRGVDAEDHSMYLFPMSSETKASDFGSFFVIKETEDEVVMLDPAKVPDVNEDIITSADAKRTPRITSLLILGTGRMVRRILKEDNEYFEAMGITSDVIIAHEDDSVLDFDTDEIREKYSSLNISVKQCNIRKYDILRELVESTGVKSVIVLGDPGLSQRQADEKTLSLLVFLQRIRENYDSRNNDFNITCDIAIENTRKLADLTGANDFVVGNSMTAFILTQITMYPELYDIINELLSGSSVGMYMRPMTDYIDFGNRGKMEADLFTIAESAGRRNEVFLGIHRLAFNRDTGEMYYTAPEINPPKWEDAEHTTPKKYTFWAEDEAVVISVGVGKEEAEEPAADAAQGDAQTSDATTSDAKAHAAAPDTSEPEDNVEDLDIAVTKGIKDEVVAEAADAADDVADGDAADAADAADTAGELTDSFTANPK